LFIDSFITSILHELHSVYGNYLLVAIMTFFLGIATYTDVKSFKIPNKLNFTMSIIALILIFFDFSFSTLFVKLSGAFVGFFMLFLPAMIKNHAMGGDIKAVTVIGLFIGVKLIIPFLVLACLFGSLFIILRIHKGSLFSVMPFAPFFFISHITLFIFSLWI